MLGLGLCVFDVGVRVMLWLWLFYMLGHMCANIFLKYLLDICVFLIIVGMGRTCVYVHHVDKEAFLKGNIGAEPG